MTRLRLLPIVLLACGPESTSFRTTDKSDEAVGASTAVYDVRVGGEVVANVRVWTNGGFIGATDEPMTHVGFEIRNTAGRDVKFDADALRLVVFDKQSFARKARFVAVTPLGPALLTIAPDHTLALDSYFLIPMRPREVDHMRASWSLRAGSSHFDGTTSFVRDDNNPILEPQTPPPPAS